MGVVWDDVATVLDAGLTGEKWHWTFKTRKSILIYYYYYLEPIHDKCNISAGGSNQRSSFQAGPALRDNILGLV